jgi:hypothetical protein
MITKYFRCVGRYKDGKTITGYKLVDDEGNTRTVRASSLKDAIKSGEAVVFNLSMTKDGRIIPKLGKDTVGVPFNSEGRDPRLAKKENKGTKVISIEDIAARTTGLRMLKSLLDAFDAANIPARIIECGHDTRGNKTEAYLFIQSGRKPQGFSYIKDRRHGEFELETPINMYDADDEESALAQITDDAEAFYNENAENIRKLGYSTITNYENMIRIEQDFNITKIANSRIVVSGNNIVYLEPKDLDAEVIEIPEACTIISNSAFENSPNLKKIICTKSRSMMVTEILGDRPGIRIEYSK